MKCPKCKSGNREGVKFCEECGAKLELECPECKAIIPLGKKFCGDCGFKLTKASKTVPIDYTQPHSYTPKFLADKILTTRSSIEGERKLVTVLFADVTNYTAMSEKLDPEEVHQIMDECFKILIDEIHKYEGTINQFTGDGVMALFGAPVAHEDHAQRACHASLSIQKNLAAYGTALKKKYGIDFKMRIGLNSGQVVVGSIGDDLRMDYTAVGDTTNLAARTQGAAKPGGILATGQTYKLAGDFFEFQSANKITVKGKERPVEVWRLLKSSKVETRITAAIAKGLTKFVGRNKEIETLKEAFEKTRLGQGQIVGVVGEAGVGKSRLLLELRNSLPKGEYMYLEGRCLHYGDSIPYRPIMDCIRSYVGIKEGEQELVINNKMKEKILDLDQNLKTALPPFQELLSVTVEDGEYLKLEPKRKRDKTFEAIRDVLIRGAQETTLVLAIEDLHWIDKTSEALLDYLIGWLANAKILLILLYRPEYTHAWGSKSYYSKIGVDQLSTGSSTDLVKSILAGNEVAPELRELILSRTSGNPLFMEELTHTLLENGSIQKKDNRFFLIGNPSEIKVPDTIQGIIASRMDRLEEGLKRIMQLASVIGREFAFRILQDITEIREELKSYLLNLQGLEFIYEKRLFPELEYVFKHALTQEVAYNSLLLKRRKEIHENIGNAMEEIYGDRLEEFYEMLAYHYSKSVNLEKAYRYLTLSGNKASRNHSLWEAFRYYKAAIVALDKIPATEKSRKEKLKIIIQLSIPMGLLGYPEDSLEILEDGGKLAKELTDDRSIATLYSKIGNCYTHNGKPLLGLKYVERGFEAAQKIQDIQIVAESAFYLVTSCQVLGKYQKIIDIVPSVLDLIEEEKKEHAFFIEINTYAGLCAYYGISKGFMGKYEECNVFFEKSLQLAEKIKDPRTLGLVEFLYASSRQTKGDWEDSKRHLENAIHYLEEAKWNLLIGLAWSALGYTHSYLEDPELALKYIKKGLNLQIAGNIKGWMSIHYFFLGKTYFDLNDLIKAEKYLKKALTISKDNHERFYEGSEHIMLGRILGKKDPLQFIKAEESILHGMSILEELNNKPLYAIGFLALGELYLVVGKNDTATEKIKMADEMFQEMGMAYWYNLTQAILQML